MRTVLRKELIQCLIFALLGCCSSKSYWHNRLKEDVQRFSKIQLLGYELLLQEWTDFKEINNKSYYSDKEDLKRLGIFAQNKLFIATHNDLYDKGLVTYTLKMNKFGDMTAEEFKEIYLLTNKQKKKKQQKKMISEMSYASLIENNPPDEFDWRSRGVVTEVKDQGNCGSCWAFSATGVLEANFFRKNKYLVSLSEQNLIDCSGNFSTAACLGGKPSDAFKYIQQNNGIDTEKSYEYRGGPGLCRYDPKYAIACPGVIYGVPQNEITLKVAVSKTGPVSVIVHVEDTFRFYEKGVYYSKSCSSYFRNLNHAMLVVGYGVDDFGGDYWLVKNSYGIHWGEEGYIRMARNRGNNCGIVTEATIVD